MYLSFTVPLDELARSFPLFYFSAYTKISGMVRPESMTCLVNIFCFSRLPFDSVNNDFFFLFR